MIKIQINQRELSVPEGTRLLDAIRQQGFAVPTLCYRDGLPHFTSCMLCVVQEVRSGRLLPSCSLAVADGMVIETENEAVRKARQEALELLMSDHTGDCIAPCQRTCPAHMNIPLMNMHIEAGRLRDALITVKEHIALPAVLGRICQAPCEKNCRRDLLDSSIAICALKCYVADQDLDSDTPYLPERRPPSGKRVAIVGSGPAGLSAAYYLQQLGHQCTIVDDRAEPGGMLRYGVPEEVLPRTVLDAEIEIIRRLGTRFVMQQKLGVHVQLAELQRDFDAVVLALGQINEQELQTFAVETTARSIRVDSTTFVTSVPGIYAGGGVVNPGRMAVRSVGHGRTIALAVDRYLLGLPAQADNSRSQSRIGKVERAELESLATGMVQLKRGQWGREPETRGIPPDKTAVTAAQAMGESTKCVQCGCASYHHCALRRYAEEYDANTRRFKGQKRRPLQRIVDHPYVVFEPGKCIQCGLCVRITEREKDILGLTFIGRGFDVCVGVSLNGTLAEGLAHLAEECVDACPSGALEFKANFCTP